MISWAQNFEDVLLARAFSGRRGGYYIDIGAYDPDDCSVTRHFYDIGWRGINIEPQPEPFARLAAARPDDVNLRVAIGREAGTMTIWRGATPGESSAQRPEGSTDSFVVPCMTLAELCRRHVTRPIDFLKVDVEGLELDVIESGDWERFRPAVVVAEVTEPWSTARRDDAAKIAEALRRARYDEAWFDGLNGYYVADEAANLVPALALPPNVLDGFVTVQQAKLAEALAAVQTIAERERKEAEQATQQLARATSELAIVQTQQANQALEVERRAGEVAVLLAKAEADIAVLDAERRRLEEETRRLAARGDALQKKAERQRQALAAYAERLAAARAESARLETRHTVEAREWSLQTDRQRAEAAALFGSLGETRALAEHWQARAAHAEASFAEIEARYAAAAREWGLRSARQRAEAAALFASLGEARALAEHWEARAAHAEASFAEIERSRSWRVTAPLRALRRLLRSARA